MIPFESPVQPQHLLFVHDVDFATRVTASHKLGQSLEVVSGRKEANHARAQDSRKTNSRTLPTLIREEGHSPFIIHLLGSSVASELPAPNGSLAKINPRIRSRIRGMDLPDDKSVFSRRNATLKTGIFKREN